MIEKTILFLITLCAILVWVELELLMIMLRDRRKDKLARELKEQKVLDAI